MARSSCALACSTPVCQCLCFGVMRHCGPRRWTMEHFQHNEISLSNPILLSSAHLLPPLRSTQHFIRSPLPLHPSLQLISVVRTQIPQLHLLIRRQPHVSDALLPLPVLPRAHDEIRHTAQRTQTYEPDTDRVPALVERPVRLQEAVHGYDSSNVSETYLPRTPNGAAMVAA
jgi:hypothetical protein